MDGRVAARKTQKPSSKSERIVQIFLVLSVAPFGLIGVVAALLIAGKPLGFVAILGVLASLA
jgi:multidrug efflux pump subunit AcrB